MSHRWHVGLVLAHTALPTTLLPTQCYQYGMTRKSLLTSQLLAGVNMMRLARRQIGDEEKMHGQDDRDDLSLLGSRPCSSSAGVANLSVAAAS